MTATREGGLKIAAKMTKLDPDYYRKIGAIGGRNGTGKKGFALMDREKVSAAGMKGGTKSRRGLRLSFRQVRAGD